MKTTALIKLAASTLILGATMVGCSPSTQASHPATASNTKMAKIANKAAMAASRALASRDFATAITCAETAVAALPRDAGYRMLLGQAYLGSGRFTSAETAFSETLTLMPDHGRAALNLALVQIALGKNAAALTTLNDYRDRIGASDYGLALALAGDTTGGVQALESAVATSSNPKTRQNLALAYALAGKWTNAHVTALQDMAPADADARIMEWSKFVHPVDASNQVASLLGVKPVSDAGQPTRLALAPTADNAVQVALADAPAPIAAPVAAVAAAATPVADPTQAAFEVAAPASVVKTATDDAPVIHAAATPAKQQIVATPHRNKVASTTPARTVQSGRFVVQLGAFENVAVSRNSWNRAASRFSLQNYEPGNSFARVSGINFVRLSVGGFANRAEATQVCTRIKAEGGNCFVRGMMSDKPAQWVQRGLPKPTRLASR